MQSRNSNKFPVCSNIPSQLQPYLKTLTPPWSDPVRLILMSTTPFFPIFPSTTPLRSRLTSKNRVASPVPTASRRSHKRVACRDKFQMHISRPSVALNAGDENIRFPASLIWSDMFQMYMKSHAVSSVIFVRFSTSSRTSLARHVARIHSEDRLKCLQRGQSYVNDVGLQVHIRSKRFQIFQEKLSQTSATQDSVSLGGSSYPLSDWVFARGYAFLLLEILLKTSYTSSIHVPVLDHFRTLPKAEDEAEYTPNCQWIAISTKHIATTFVVFRPWSHEDVIGKADAQRCRI